MKYSTLSLLLGTTLAANSYNGLVFQNSGFPGYYSPVSKIEHAGSDRCTCSVGPPVSFSGTNAPLNEPVSVHFRGPLKLHTFAYYTSPSFTIGSSSSSDWQRNAFYDSSSQTAENVTFLTTAGEHSKCLGPALTYADSDGVSKANDRTVLKDNTLITSDQMFTIMSNVSCEKSGLNNDCGVYRNGIPAYHGYSGDVKMFLFEFEMPTEQQTNSTNFEFFDMPAIWLLNAKIPRTSQFPTNPNCSCWSSGCGEFDIFEVMNGTQRNNLYSTFHDFQGIDDIGTGIQSGGYISRDTSNTMLGGVIFDSEGTTISFLSNGTSFNTTLSANTVNQMISNVSPELSMTMATVTSTPPKSSKGAASVFGFNGGSLYVLILAAVFQAVL